MAAQIARRAALSVGVFVLMAAQPARLAHAQMSYRMPVYGSLSTGSVRAARQVPAVRRIFTDFPMPMLSDETFPFEAAGGRIADDAPFDLHIDEHGGIRFTPAQ